MRVRVPGSSANIGAGFDVLALAVDRHYELSTTPLDGFEPVPVDDLVWTALSRIGVEFDDLWFRSDLPRGRGLGSSAAACVAAAYIGYRSDGLDPPTARDAAFEAGRDIEGHPDNASASAFGGLTLAVDGRIHVDRPAITDGQLFIWMPANMSLTKETRARLPLQISVAEAVGQSAACAAIYAGLRTGSWELMQGGNGDRIHEPHRLENLPDSRAVIDQLRAEGHVAWLSGSGPGVAALIESDGDRFRPVAAGDWLSLRVDNTGCIDVG